MPNWMKSPKKLREFSMKRDCRKRIHLHCLSGHFGGLPNQIAASGGLAALRD